MTVPDCRIPGNPLIRYSTHVEFWHIFTKAEWLESMWISSKRRLFCDSDRLQRQLTPGKRYCCGFVVQYPPRRYRIRGGLQKDF